MSVIDIELAMKHLLAEPEDKELVQSQLDGAEEAAQQFLQRRFFAEQADVDRAKAEIVPRTQAPITINAPVTVQAQPGVSDADAMRQGKAAGAALAQEVRSVLQREMGQGGLLWRRT